MFYYVNYKDNWADEMFVDGFSIMDEKEYEHYTATVNAIVADIECGLPFIYQIGTNEEIKYKYAYLDDGTRYATYDLASGEVIVEQNGVTTEYNINDVKESFHTKKYGGF